MFDKKKQLLLEMYQQVENEMNVLRKSVANAAAAATHPENKPEHKYDTRGLEASYLAGAQQDRLGELEGALLFLKSVALRHFTENDRVAPTALVQLVREGEQSFYFLLSWGAGYTLELADIKVLTITPQSPLGQGMIGKVVGDVIKVLTGKGHKE